MTDEFQARLAEARLYLCTDARPKQDDFAAFVDAAFAGGVDIIQLRDKSIEAARELETLQILSTAAARHGKAFAVNDRADIAAISAAPVLHLGQDDLSPAQARRLLDPAVAIGLSTHSPAQVDAALSLAAPGGSEPVGSTPGGSEPGRPEPDYFCTGPLWQTPTKPGRAAVGLDLVKYAARRQAELGDSTPWFAIGGIDHTNIGRVVDAGARRVVVVRAITEATDPQAAAAALLAQLPT